jgi:CO/xanthine dehydrogenase FAD-binding subunit
MINQPIVHSPANLADALAVLAEKRDAVKIIAGGTDLMVLMNAGMLDAPEFLNIWAIDKLRGIDDEEDVLRVGALTTYSQIIRSPLVRRDVPSLVEASRTVGAIQIQNRGTIGGNIVNGSPAGDSLPVLAVYDAEIEIASLRGGRRVRFGEFYTGYRRTVLEPDELVVAIRISKLKDGERDFFWKVGTRRAQAISKTVMAIKAQVNARTIQRVAIGVGSVAPTVIRARATEALLAGAQITDAQIERARASIAREIAPITDLRSTEHYRRTVTANMLARFLRSIE